MVRSSRRKASSCGGCCSWWSIPAAAPSGSWAQTVEGPSGVNLITAASDTATESGAVGSYSAFQDTMDEWQDTLVNWRCRLSAGRSPPLRRAAGMELPGREILRRPHRLRAIGRRSARPRSTPWRRASSCRRIRSTCSIPPGAMRSRRSTVFRSFLGSLGDARAARRAGCLARSPSPQRGAWRNSSGSRRRSAAA